MAEQAINTVYTLAERPDIFCGKLIKNLTRRVFGAKQDTQETSASAGAPEPEADGDAMALDEAKLASTASGAEAGDKDVGDAFELSQLLFVVGHVAIKHIVFLELVEREWKRQKHEREQGVSVVCPRLPYSDILTFYS